MNRTTRENIAAHGVSIWLKPDVEVLLARVRKKSNRPLLKTADPEQTLRRLLEERSPIYALADLTIDSRDGPHDAVVEAVLRQLAEFLHEQGPASSAGRRRVEVALGARAYSILIGPGLIDAAGAEIARIAPGATCAIVTDANVAPLYLAASVVEPRQCRAALDIDHLPAGRGDEVLRRIRACLRRADRSPHRAARRRRSHSAAASSATSPGSAPPACAGACASSRSRPPFLRRSIPASAARPGSIRRMARTLSAPSISLRWCWPISSAWTRLSGREFRAGYAEVVKYGLIGDRDFFELLEGNWRECSPAARRAPRRSQRAAPPRRVWSSPTKPSRASGRCSISATPSATPSRALLTTTARLVHGEGVASAWPALSASRAIWAFVRGRTRRGSKPT